MKINVLDHGYVELVEAWGTGHAGIDDDREFEVTTDYEVGIIEAARQSTQGSFRGWEPAPCTCDASLMSSNPHRNDCASILHPGDRKLLKFLYTKGHSTPFEFAGMTLGIQAPIFVFREWQRHRTQSYSESSARYAPLAALDYIPTLERVMVDSGSNKQAGAIKGASELTTDAVERFRHYLNLHYQESEGMYQQSLEAGIPKELARCFLPVGRYSKMRASANLRNWLQFLTLRMDPAAQFEIRQYAHAVAAIIAEIFPKTFGLFSETLKSG
jgi:thymidylate synthase (FAD)